MTMTGWQMEVRSAPVPGVLSLTHPRVDNQVDDAKFFRVGIVGIAWKQQNDCVWVSVCEAEQELRDFQGLSE
jgi:hypothetical protein